MDFQVPIQIPTLSTPISYKDRLLLVGSCFTEHIGNKLEELKFSILQNPNGILFDPASIAASLVSYIQNKQYTEQDLFFLNELWQSWHHHSRFSGTDQKKVLENINRSQQRAHEFLKTANWLIITPGTSFSYRLRPGSSDSSISKSRNPDSPDSSFSNSSASPDSPFSNSLTAASIDSSTSNNLTAGSPDSPISKSLTSPDTSFPNTPDSPDSSFSNSSASPGTSFPNTPHSPLTVPVANCHRAPAAWFDKHLMTIEETNSALDNCLHQLFQFNPSLKIIFTVSPVRHIRDGVIDNNRSKARLLEVVHNLVNKFDRLYYFPAYELVIDVLRDYRFYDVDMVHPNYQGTQFVLEKFMQHCVDDQSRTLSEEIQKLVIARRHKPFQPDTAAHKKFLQLHLEKAQAMQQQHPYLDLKQEIEYFKG